MLTDGVSVRCAQCGVRLDVPEGVAPQVSIEGASGASNMRILSIDGKEIHRCMIVTRGDLSGVRRPANANWTGSPDR
jgi:hypothetical protein